MVGNPWGGRGFGLVGVFEKKKSTKKNVDSKIGQHFFWFSWLFGEVFFWCCNAWKKRSVSPVSKGVFHCGHLQDAQNLLTIRFLDEHGERTLEKTFSMFFHMEKVFDQQRPSTPVGYILRGLGKKSAFLFGMIFVWGSFDQFCINFTTCAYFSGTVLDGWNSAIWVDNQFIPLFWVYLLRSFSGGCTAKVGPPSM